MDHSVLTQISVAYPPRPRAVVTVPLPDKGVHSMVVLPDGDTCVVSAENDGALRVVSLRRGEVVDSLTAHTMPVNSLSLAADGKLLLSASDDATVRVWDTTTWQVTAVLEGHEGFIRQVAGAGLVAVSGGEDGTVRVWDLAEGVCRGVFDDHSCSVDVVAISPDGRRAASSSRDNAILLWDLTAPRLERALYRTEQEVWDLPDNPVFGSTYLLLGANDSGVGHRDAPDSMGFEPSSGLLYTAANEVICWDPIEGQELIRLPGEGHSVAALAWHPTLPLMVTASLLGLRLSDHRGEWLTALALESFDIVDVAFVADGRLISAHKDGMLRVWPAHTGAEQDGERHSASVNHITIDRTGRFAATESENREVMLWNLATGRRVAAVDAEPASHSRMTFTADGGRLVVSDGDGLTVQDTTGGDPETLTPAQLDRLHVVGIAAVDSTSVLISQYEASPIVLSLNGSGRRVLHGDVGKSIKSVQVTSDGRYALMPVSLKGDHPLIAEAAAETAVSPFGIPALQCWDLHTGELLWTRHGAVTDEVKLWPCHAWVTLLGDGTAVSPAGYGTHTSLLFLDVPSGAVLREVAIAESAAECPPYELSDGALLIVSGSELWRLASTATYPQHHLSLPDGWLRPIPERDLVLRRQDTKLHCHRLSTGTELATHELPAAIRELEVAPDSRTVVIGDRDGAVHIFQVA